MQEFRFIKVTKKIGIKGIFTKIPIDEKKRKQMKEAIMLKNRITHFIKKREKSLAGTIPQDFSID